jgi:hypothetical protein
VRTVVLGFLLVLVGAIIGGSLVAINDFGKKSKRASTPVVAANVPDDGKVRRERLETRYVQNPPQWLPAASASSELVSNPSAPPEGATEREIVHRDQAEFLTAHAAEARDSSWASGAELTISSTLLKLGERFGFRTGRVECRTTKCKADIEFPSQSKAIAQFSSLLHEVYEPNCTVSILLPDGAPPDSPVAAPLRFDCEESRIASIQR